MKRELILHIGLSKTGSSSIQLVLAAQREAMAKQGVYYPSSPGWANHALLPAAFVHDPRILWGFHPGTWEGLTPAVRIARFRDEFATEMKAMPASADRVVISAEQCGGLLREDDEVERMGEMLRSYFDPIRVVVYIRRQDLHAASAYSQWLRGGLMLEPGLPNGGPAELPDYDYGGILDRWATSFGQSAMEVRLFERDKLLKGDVVEDFLQIAGLTLPPLDDESAKQSNPSINLAGQNLMLVAGRKMAKGYPDDRWRDTPAWRRFAEAVTDAMPGKGWRPTRSEATTFMQRFADTNERARARFFPDRKTLFTMNFEELSETPVRAAADGVTDAALTVLLHEVSFSAQKEAQSAMAQFRLHKRLEDKSAQRACLVRAVKFDPEMLQARLRLGQFFIDEGDFRQAVQHAEAAVRIAPDDDRAKRLLKQATGGETTPLRAVG